MEPMERESYDWVDDVDVDLDETLRRLHRLEVAPVVTTPPGQSVSKSHAPDSDSISSVEHDRPISKAEEDFLTDMHRRIELSTQDAKQEAEYLRFRERRLLALYVLTIGAAMALIVGAAILFTFRGLASAIVTGVVGFVSGLASILIRHAAGLADARRSRLVDREQEEARILRTVSIALMIPNREERYRTMAALVLRLVDHIGNPTLAAAYSTEQYNGSGERSDESFTSPASNT